MIFKIITFICMIIAFLEIFSAVCYNDVSALLGWLFALVFEGIVLVSDLRGEEISPEVDKLIKSKINAFNKLMDLTKEPK